MMNLPESKLRQLFPRLGKQTDAAANLTPKGRRAQERQIADSLSRVLTNTRSLNYKALRQQGAAAEDGGQLKEQVAQIEELVAKGTAKQIEKYLAGKLDGTDLQDLLDDFSKLNDLVSEVSRNSPVAIAKMIRGQVATLNSNKTSNTRKANAISNFQKTTGMDLGAGQSLEEIIEALDQGSVDLQNIAQVMERTMEARMAENETNEALTTELENLVEAMDSGLLSTQDLKVSIEELLPTIESSALASGYATELAEAKDQREVLEKILEELQDNDPSNVDNLNLRESLQGLETEKGPGFRERLDGLTPDAIKDGARTGKGIIFDLMKGGLLLTLLGSAGVMKELGKAAQLALVAAKDWFVDTALPIISEKLRGMLTSLFTGIAESDAFDAVKNFGSWLLSPITTFRYVLSDAIDTAIARLKAAFTPGSDPNAGRSILSESRNYAAANGYNVVIMDGEGEMLVAEPDGRVRSLSRDERQKYEEGGSIGVVVKSLANLDSLNGIKPPKRPSEMSASEFMELPVWQGHPSAMPSKGYRRQGQKPPNTGIEVSVPSSASSMKIASPPKAPSGAMPRVASPDTGGVSGGSAGGGGRSEDSGGSSAVLKPRASVSDELRSLVRSAGVAA